MRPTQALLALTLSAACFALPAAEEPLPAFTAATADGAPVRGPLGELKPDWSLRLGDKALSAAEVVSLRRADAKLPPLPSEQHLLLANGDRVPAGSPRLAKEKLFFTHPDLGDGQEVSVPLSAVSVLWLAPPDGAEHPDLLLRRLAAASRPRDRVLLRNGDVVEGTLAGLDAARVRLDAEGKELELERGKVAVVALNTDLPRSLRPRGQYGRLVLANGCRLSLASARCDGRLLAARTLVGASVEVPLEQVRALDLYQGRAVYLSDLKPRKYEHVPYLGVAWPWVADGSVAGRDLHLAGGTFDKGLGLHSASRLTYDLGGRYRRFEALVGLDERTGRGGNVVVEILVDGKPQDLGWNGTLGGGEAPLPVRLAVAGAQSLTLVVGFGRRGDVGDHVNWVDARLIK